MFYYRYLLWNTAAKVTGWISRRFDRIARVCETRADHYRFRYAD